MIGRSAHLTGMACISLLIFIISVLNLPTTTFSLLDRLVEGPRMAGLGAYKTQVHSLQRLKPLGDQSEKIMFWRPQKVGSSTILSVILSYSFRYNKLPRVKSVKNFMCNELAACIVSNMTEESKFTKPETLKAVVAYQDKTKRMMKNNFQLQRARASKDLPNSISVSHEICNLQSQLVHKYLHCIYRGKVHDKSKEVKELFAVRDPLSRMISIYYFWGELFKIKEAPEDEKRIGASTAVRAVKGSLFTYHGNESSVPSSSIAMQFANKFPLVAGNPGPSFTWSLFSNNAVDASRIVRTDRIFTIVSERLDESLIAASHYLGWSLADMIPTLPRKSLSSHPKHQDWPADAIAKIKQKLERSGEYDVYNAANETLTRKIEDLKRKGVDFEAQLKLFRELKERVSELCLKEEYLKLYKGFLHSLGLKRHHNNNKLRDSDSYYIDNGHLFDWNLELLFDYDVCGNCEAHAILVAIANNLAPSPSTAPLLKDLNPLLTENKVQFARCPKVGVSYDSFLDNEN